MIGIGDRETYAPAFFDLQLRFAEKAARLSKLPLPQALLQYTNLYIRFGLGHDFCPKQPTWREYAAGLVGASDALGWTYRFYCERGGAVTPPGFVATFGCFSYARLTADRVRLHFHNRDTDGRSSLASELADRRREELAGLFAHARQTGPESARVIGASWLYNLEAYRRLFPDSYLATARPIGGRFQHMPLWGQFLDRNGAVKARMAQLLLERLAGCASPDDLDQCFPLPVLTLEASVGECCDFYESHRGEP